MFHLRYPDRMEVRMNRFLVPLTFICLTSTVVSAQTLQKGADADAEGRKKLEISYVSFRPATWETKYVDEIDNERPNKGGHVNVYLKNFQDEEVSLTFWRANGKDESHWRLDGPMAWDRTWKKHLAPGEMTVVELNPVTDAFSAGKKFSFQYLDKTWTPACYCKGVLAEDPVQISFIRVLPDLKTLEVHVRHCGSGRLNLETVCVAGKSEPASCRWSVPAIHGVGNAVARVELTEALSVGELIITQLKVTEENGNSRIVCAHRRAFEDYFPIGVWSQNAETRAILRKMHIDTPVASHQADDPFFVSEAARLGFRGMVHTGAPVANVNTVRKLSGNPHVACWMIQDEPDWSISPQVMQACEEAVRQHDNTKPTFITLCRNVKFFEYAGLCDIPCHDHYCVTAPSSSKWEKVYGTRLEETGYYTRDLKAASEPKPIWVWTQGIGGWTERPKRHVPTPNEMAVQLLQNIGRGAKGILWFNYDEDAATKFPDAPEAMRLWGRVMSAMRDEFLASEPLDGFTVSGPKGMEILPLGGMNSLTLCLTNTQYAIHNEAYPFEAHKNVTLTVPIPEWRQFQPTVALRIDETGIRPLVVAAKDGGVDVTVGDLEAACMVVLARDLSLADTIRQRYDAAVADESKEY